MYKNIILIFSLIVAVTLATPGLYGTINSADTNNSTAFGVFTGQQFKILVEFDDLSAYQNSSDASCVVDDTFYVFLVDEFGDSVVLSINTTDVNSTSEQSDSIDYLTNYPLRNLFCVGASDPTDFPYMIGVQSRADSSGFLISYSDGEEQDILYQSDLFQQFWGAAYDAVGGVVYVFSMDTTNMDIIVTRYSMVAKIAQTSTITPPTTQTGLYGAVFGMDGNIYGLASSNGQTTYQLFSYDTQQNDLTVFNGGYTLPAGAQIYNAPQTTMSSTVFTAKFLISTPAVDFATLLIDFDIITSQPTPTILANVATESLNYVSQ